LGIFNIVEGICDKSPFKKCGTSPKIRVLQMLKTFKCAPFGNHSTPPSVSKRALKIAILFNAGPNISVCAFLIENARYLLDNAGPNPPLVHSHLSRSCHPQQQEERSNVVAFNCEIRRVMNWFDFRV
jgi:hypothetical protein